MSSVSSNSNSSGMDERVRQAREDYRKKESELIKKHNREIQALNDRYIRDLDKKDEVRTKSLSEMREKSQDALTNKDVRYKSEMNELKAMHSKQLEKLLQDNRAKLDAQTTATRNEIKQTRLGKTDRESDLKNLSEQQRQQQEAKFSNSLQEIREDQQAQITRAREKLNERHEAELEALRDNRNETVTNLRNENRQLYQNSTMKLKNQEVRHLQDKNRINSSHMDNLGHQAEAHNRIQDQTREAANESFNELRQEVIKRREKDQAAFESVTENNKASVNQRMDNQVNRLESDLRKTRQKSVIDQGDATRRAKSQVNQMRDAYQDKFDYLEKARIETLKQSNDISAQTANQITAQANRQMSENTKYYNSRNQIDNMKSRQYIDDLRKEQKLSGDYQKTNAENRINRVRENSIEEQNTLKNVYGTNLETLKLTAEEEKKELLIGFQKDKLKTESTYKNLFQEQELSHQKEADTLVAKYEKRISELNDQFMREKRLRDTREKSLINEMKRRHDSEVEALKIKYEDQGKQTAINHEREINDVQRRSHEKLDEVLNSIKKT